MTARPPGRVTRGRLARKPCPVVHRHVVEDAAREDDVEARRLERERRAVVRNVFDARVAFGRPLDHRARHVEADDAAEVPRQVLVDEPDARADVERFERRRVADLPPGEVDEPGGLRLAVEARLLAAERDRPLQRALVAAFAVPVELGH